MKKLLLLLLFIPVVSFGQVSYEAIMKLNSKDAFVKYMFDAGFSFDTANSSGDDLTYVLNPIISDDEYEPKGTHIACWYEDFFWLYIRLEGFDENDYSTILKKVKTKCKYIKMEKGYAVYECPDAKFEGKRLWFAINDGMGEIIGM